MIKLKVIQVFPRLNFLGYHMAGDVVNFEDNEAKELVDNGFAEFFEEVEPQPEKEDKTKKTTKEDKTKLQTKELKFEKHTVVE